MVSRLPIKEGDPVYFVLLSPSPSAWRIPGIYDKQSDFRLTYIAGQFCETHGLMFPQTPLMRGVYTGYGTARVEEKGACKQALKDRFREAGVKQIKYALWPSSNRDKLDVNKMLKAAERGALSLPAQTLPTTYYPEVKTLPVGVALIHTFIADAMVAALAKPQRDHYETRMGLFVNESPGARPFLLTFADTLFSLPPGELGVTFFLMWLLDHRDSISEKERQKLADCLTFTANFTTALRAGRFAWGPVPSAGSGSDDMKMQHIVAKEILKRK
jgi:hypothetical protein